MPLQVQIEKQLANYMLDVSFTAADATLSVLGASGSGKTMTLRCIAGLENPDRGRIVLNDRVLFDSEHGIRLPARERRIGMMFQHYALFPHLTVAQNIAFGLENLMRLERDKRIAERMKQVHLEGLEERRPHELSGGEQQRVALARALAIRPEALLLDEPLSALDTHLRSQMETLLQDVFDRYRGPSLLVTHNIEEAYRLGNQMLVLSQGRSVAFGSKEEIFRRPPTLEVARLTGCKNFSRVVPVSDTEVEATDWNCRLRVSQPVRGSKHVGIRAHHLDFMEAAPKNAAVQNVFPCWLVRSSETPFRITLYLQLHNPPGSGGEHHLQAEVFKEKWRQFQNHPQPWHVRLDPGALFLVSS